MTDYGSPVPQQLVFAVGTSRVCTAIGTANDSVYENDESFTVSISLMTNNADITVTVTTAAVSIIDDDCTFFFCYCYI